LILLHFSPDVAGSLCSQAGAAEIVAVSTPVTMKNLLPPLLLLLLFSCTASKEVVQDGFLQKRKYGRGWHMDMPQRKGQEVLAAAPAVDAEPERTTVDHLSPLELGMEPLAAVDVSCLPQLRRTIPSVVAVASHEQPPNAAVGRAREGATYNGGQGPAFIPLQKRTPASAPVDGSSVFLLTSGLLVVLPAAFALVALYVLQRSLRMADGGSSTAYLALVMGVLALMALALL
jgi:hypothetical protein